MPSSWRIIRRMPRSLSVLVVLAAVGCAHPSAVTVPAKAPSGAEGVASYYSSALEGQRTASGETYRGEDLTCAHRTLPFGTKLRVTELTSGRSVVCRVNDRGPFVNGRIVDVSL